MSLESNLKGVKESFSNDKKILESAFTLEILWRRYRKYVIAIIVCGAVALIWQTIDSCLDSQRSKEASAAYLKLVEDSTDMQALESLKKASPALYDMYSYFNANGDISIYERLVNSSNEFVRSIARYEVASLKASDLDLLENQKKDGDSVAITQSLQDLENTKPTILRNLAILQEACLLFDLNRIDEAHQKLLLIPENTMLYEEALNLRHFGIKFLASNKDK